MKKNGQYVGVDEKFIPEEEKYVDNETNKEIKDSINDGLRSVKDYVTDKDNQGKFKNTGKKGLKVLKGVGIGYLIFIGLIFVFMISIIVVVLVSRAKINDKANDVYDRADAINEKVTEEIDKNSNQTNTGNSDVEIKAFNAPFELYNGSQSGYFLEKLIDKVVTNNKTESDHIITVVYNETMTAVPDEISDLKQNFDGSKEYEVSLGYDKDGFVNKITIQ